MQRPINTWRDVLHVLRAPDELLEAHLRGARPLVPELAKWLLPPLLIRPATVLFRSLIVDAPLTAGVLATSSLALQLGVWLAVSVLLPTIAHQFHASIREREAVLLSGFASLPLWLAGGLFLVPDSFPFLFWWSRVLVFFLALYGVFIVHRGFAVLDVRTEAHWPLVAAFSTAYLAIYALLFTLLGLSSHVVLLVLGASP